MAHAQLTIMLDAQGIEKELINLKQESDIVSAPLEKTRARRSAARQDLVALQQKLENLQKQRKEAESQLADAEGRAKTATERQQTASSAREVTDLEKMHDQATAAALVAEESVLTLLEREDELSKRIAQAEATTAKNLEQIEAEIERLSASLAEKQDLAKDLRQDRIAVLNRMEADVRDHYEWLIRKHGAGQAVSAIMDGACGGCGSALLPDQVYKLRDVSQLHKCTHCYRYLIPTG